MRFLGSFNRFRSASLRSRITVVKLPGHSSAQKFSSHRLSCIGSVANSSLIPSSLVRSISAFRCFSTHSSAESKADQWYRDASHPKTVEILKAESKRIQKYRLESHALQNALYVNMRKRVNHVEDNSIPERIYSHLYYMKTDPQQNYPIYVRRKSDGAGLFSQLKGTSSYDEQVVLDQNELSKQYSTLHIHAMKVSPDERFLAFTMDTTGEEVFDGYLRDIVSGKVFRLPSLKNIYSIEWSSTKDPLVLYYTKTDENRRPFQVYRHTLMSRESDELIYEEKDSAFYVDVQLTKDKKFITISTNSKTTSEVRVLNAHGEQNKCSPKPILLKKREKGTSYFVDHSKDRFFIVTNADKAQNYKIVTMADAVLGQKWKTVVEDSSATKIDDIDVFEKFVVLYEKHRGLARIRVVDSQTFEAHVVQMDDQHETIGVISPGVNQMFSTDTFRFTFSSPLVPEIVYEYEFSKRKLSVLKSTSVMEHNAYTSRFEKEFRCSRLHVPSSQHSDVSIPLTVVHHKDLTLEGKNPCLMIAYGAYGYALEPDFHLDHLSLLEDGWVIALAHIRGGNELGLEWYNAGKQLNKKNSFADFIDCAEFVIEQQYTRSDILAGMGTSAAGLVLGYVANERPELFRSMVMKVPFVDIAETMQDASLPLTVHEYDEWGNPAQCSHVREYLESYAPVSNVRVQKYPNLFVTGSMMDQRVQFWEPLKWVQAIRKKNGHLKGRKLLLDMRDEDGHFGPDGQLDQLSDAAMEYAFLYDTLGLEYNAPMTRR